MRRVGGLWGHFERQRGGGGDGCGNSRGGWDGGSVVTGGSSWSRVRVVIVVAGTVLAQKPITQVLMMTNLCSYSTNDLVAF